MSYANSLKCPYCGLSKMIYKGVGLTYPATDIYFCDNCKKETTYPIYTSSNNTLTVGRMGWICPNCNIGINPNLEICPKCDTPSFINDNYPISEISPLTEIYNWSIIKPITKDSTKKPNTINKKKTENSENKNIKR